MKPPIKNLKVIRVPKLIKWLNPELQNVLDPGLRKV